MQSARFHRAGGRVRDQWLPRFRDRFPRRLRKTWKQSCCWMLGQSRAFVCSNGYAGPAASDQGMGAGDNTMPGERQAVGLNHALTLISGALASTNEGHLVSFLAHGSAAR